MTMSNSMYQRYKSRGDKQRIKQPLCLGSRAMNTLTVFPTVENDSPQKSSVLNMTVSYVKW